MGQDKFDAKSEIQADLVSQSEIQLNESQLRTEAATCNFWLLVNEAIRFLKTVGALPNTKSGQVPFALVAEVAAALQLYVWMSSDMYEPLREELDSAFEAMHESQKDVVENWQAYDSMEKMPPLMDKISAISLKHFSWSGFRELNAPILLDNVDDNELVNALAAILWKHRNVRDVK